MEMYGAMEEANAAEIAIQNIQPQPQSDLLVVEKDVRYPDPIGAY
jgi:hypothetical protein